MTNFKHELFSGVFFIGVSKYSHMLIQLVVTSILARIINPDDFGVVAIATVIMIFIEIFRGIGIGQGIIQNKELSKSDIEHIFSFTVFQGLFLSGIFFLSSNWISTFYNNDLLVPICKILSIAVFFNCVLVVPIGLLNKKKNFAFQAKANLILNIFCGSIAVLTAVKGLGIFSLIVFPTLFPTLLFFSYFINNPLSFHPKVSFGSLKKIFSYSAYVFMFHLVNYFSRNLDKLLIGRMIGMGPLGYYEKSYRLMQMPLQNITYVITPVLHPILSEYQNNKEVIVKEYLKLFQLLAYISFPLSVILWHTSTEIVITIFGDKWYPAVSCFKILSLTVSLQMLNGTAGAVFQAVNSTREYFFTGLWCTFFMITSFLIGIQFWGTIEAVAWSFVVAQLLNSSQTYYRLFGVLNYPLINVVKLLVKPILCCIVVFFILLGVDNLIGNFALLFRLFMKLIIGLVIGVCVISCFSDYKISDRLKSLVKGSKK